MLIINTSEDRAFELDIFLSLLKKNTKNYKQVYCLYSCSTENYEKGYDILREKFSRDKKIIFSKVENGNLKDSILDVLSNAKEKFVLFTESNTYFHKKVDFEFYKDIFNYESDEKVVSFSFLLGKNIIKHSEVNADNILIPEREEKDYLVFDWTKHYLDFNKPFLMHGYIYLIEDIKKIIKNTFFNNSFELNENIQKFDNFYKTKMICPINSCCFISERFKTEKQDYLVKLLSNVKVLSKKFYDYHLIDSSAKEKVQDNLRFDLYFKNQQEETHEKVSN